MSKLEIEKKNQKVVEKESSEVSLKETVKYTPSEIEFMIKSVMVGVKEGMLAVEHNHVMDWVIKNEKNRLNEAEIIEIQNYSYEVLKRGGKDFRYNPSGTTRYLDDLEPLAKKMRQNWQEKQREMIANANKEVPLISDSKGQLLSPVHVEPVPINVPEPSREVAVIKKQKP